MFGASLPPKRKPSLTSAKSQSMDNFYRKVNLDSLKKVLDRPSMSNGNALRSMSESLELDSDCEAVDLALKLCDQDIRLLRLNVGGTSFKLQPKTILKRCSNSLLYQMLFLDHDGRARLADYYLDESSEYFFERSSEVFQIIYNFYVHGVCHKPTSICLDIFLAELTFWNINEAIFAQCCIEAVKGDTAGAAVDETGKGVTLRTYDSSYALGEFRLLRWGWQRKMVWNFMEEPESSVGARIFGCMSIGAVLIAIGIMIAASIPELQVPYFDGMEDLEQNSTEPTSTKTYTKPHPFLRYAEYICMCWFTLEYLIKMLVAANRWRTFCQILNIVDLVAIVPFYFELSLELAGVNTQELEELNGALLMIRILRVSRVIRIFKLGRYSSGLRAFARTLKHSQKQLSMLAVVLTTGIMFFSTLVYNLEKDAPNTKFKSIPAAFWWCIVTMTTVGYGDMVPETNIGKLVGSGAIACGVLVLALPITIIVDNFMKVHEEDQQLSETHPLVKRQMSFRMRKMGSTPMLKQPKSRNSSIEKF